MNKLTQAQQKVFDFLCSFTEIEGYPPTYSDIASNFGFSSDGTVRSYLETLEKKGFIKRLSKARGIKILKASILKSIPILGHIAAGPLEAAIENQIGTIQDFRELHYKDGRFALKIRGNSMKNAGILEGDVAIIQSGISISNGQIAAILIDGEATLKRIYFEKTTIRLQAENETYPDIIINKNETPNLILGKYIALIRRC
jgi:repressor LexA